MTVEMHQPANFPHARSALMPAEVRSDRTSGGRVDVSYEALSRLPTLEELNVPPQLTEAVAELFDGSAAPAVELSDVELAVRLLAFHLLRREMADRSE
jgi:hypothetical protein